MEKFVNTFASIIFFCFLLVQVFGEPWKDKLALRDFHRNTLISRSLNWNLTTPLCSNWTGVTCNDQQTRVVALRLPGVGIRGPIPMNTLSRLSGLETLSLKNNEISGVFPPDFSKLSNLTYLYLQSNMLSGALPLDFSVWPNIVVLNLSDNSFNGSIPISLSNLSHLANLDLSNNHLEGRIPNSLLRFPNSSFSGNNVTREVTNPRASSSLESDNTTHKPKNLPNKGKKIRETMLAIFIEGVTFLFGVFVLCIIVLYSQKKTKTRKSNTERQTQEEKNEKIIFFEGSEMAFDLDGLLRASTEVLGKGMFAMTLKASLEDSTTIVVKGLTEVSVEKREFEQQMKIVGDIKHENVVPLRAYYYSKDMKLIVFDYFRQGSLSTMLHGRKEHRYPLDWETRLRIIIGAARGLAHIHTQNGGKLVHGNIKSSNIFLNAQSYGCVSDLGLATIVTHINPAIQQIIGYRAPEIVDHSKSTQASDVYSFGVLILELLTGKSPLEEEGMHLVKWVNSVIQEQWTSEVFDRELLRYPNMEHNIVAMLQLGMRCAEQVEDRRPKMWEVVRMVEEIPQGNSRMAHYRKFYTNTTSFSHTVEIGTSSKFNYLTHNNVASTS